MITGTIDPRDLVLSLGASLIIMFSQLSVVRGGENHSANVGLESIDNEFRDLHVHLIEENWRRGLLECFGNKVDILQVLIGGELTDVRENLLGNIYCACIVLVRLELGV